MELRDLFIAGRRTGIFIAPQSLVAFVLSTCVVATVSRAARTIGHIDAESTIVTLLAAAVVSLGILAATLSDADARPTDARSWATSLLVAGINGLLLYVAAIGIEKF